MRWSTGPRPTAGSPSVWSGGVRYWRTRTTSARSPPSRRPSPGATSCSALPRRSTTSSSPSSTFASISTASRPRRSPFAESGRFSNGSGARSLAPVDPLVHRLRLPASPPKGRGMRSLVVRTRPGPCLKGADMPHRKLGILLAVALTDGVAGVAQVAGASSAAQPPVIADAQLRALSSTFGGATVLSTTRTVPHWHGATLDPHDGVTYGYNMVGADPN